MKKISVSRKSKVWMNVTASVTWNRPAVGIIRVEQELCRALTALYGDDFGLCIFSDGEFRPYEVSQKSSLPSTAVATDEAAEPSRRYAFPRSSTFDPVSGGGKKTKKTSPTSECIPKVEDNITYGDVIFSAGLDWNHSYIENFQKLRTTRGVKIVTVCYDVIPVVTPQYCASDVSSHFKDYFTKISWASSTILCISRSSRDDYLKVMRQIGAPVAETVVIPLGDNVPKGRGAGGAAAEISDQVQQVVAAPFILFVSTIERRKNHEVLYRAYNLLAREGHAGRLPKLVFVGMAGWGVGDLLKDIELDPLTAGLIVQLNHVSDDELGQLYEKADFCVYPSLYEGWGLPIGEALACGKAVLASAEGSIPEVGGDLVTYLDPWNPQAWADAILDLVDRPEGLRAMEAAVRKGYRVRTWRDTAEVVKAALDELRVPQAVAVTLDPGYDLFTMVGTPYGQAICSTGTAGPLTHGPYRTLPKGSYEIAVALDKLEGAAGTLRCTLRSGQASREHGTLKVDFDEHEHFGLVAILTGIHLETQIDDYEICIEISENLLVAVNKVEIKGMPSL